MLMQRDFSEGQYYITGRLDQSIFADDCEFIDPTTNVKGPMTYSKAVAALFDQSTSRADLISIEVHVDGHDMQLPACRHTVLEEPYAGVCFALNLFVAVRYRSQTHTQSQAGGDSTQP